jgi:hypothetical protein
MAQYLIRTNIDGEGWTNDGIFGRDEAIKQIEAFRQSARFAFVESDITSEIRVFLLNSKNAAPIELTHVRAKRVSDGAGGWKWYAGTTKIFFTEEP